MPLNDKSPLSYENSQQEQYSQCKQADTENPVGASLSWPFGEPPARHPCGQYRKGGYFKAQTGPCPSEIEFPAKNGSRFPFVENPLPNIPNPWKIFREDLKRVCDKESREVLPKAGCAWRGSSCWPTASLMKSVATCGPPRWRLIPYSPCARAGLGRGHLLGRHA